jgi:hypothetical protein
MLRFILVLAIFGTLSSPVQAKVENLPSLNSQYGGVLFDKHAKPLAKTAHVLSSGKASVPAGAPENVQEIVKAGNDIATKPYIWGGGHGSFKASGYDCSGSVSYALKAAKKLEYPMASGALASWGKPGKGKWVTVYANGGHAFMTVAGLRFDTVGLRSNGTRWQADEVSTAGYTIRHPAGL